MPVAVEHGVGVDLAMTCIDDEAVPVGFDDVGLAERVDVLKRAWCAEGERVWSVPNDGSCNSVRSVFHYGSGNLQAMRPLTVYFMLSPKLDGSVSINEVVEVVPRRDFGENRPRILG